MFMMFCLCRGQSMMRVAIRSSRMGATPEVGPVNRVNPATLGNYPRLPSRLFHENLLF